MECPTVKVEADNEQGFVVINESDFDSETHSLFGESEERYSAETDVTKDDIENMNKKELVAFAKELENFEFDENDTKSDIKKAILVHLKADKES